MEQNIITFTGNNEKLFSKIVLKNPNSKQKLIVPETHNVIIVKDGQMMQTLSSGKYTLGKFLDFKTEESLSVEILFMSKTAKLKLLWGTANKFLMFDIASGENYLLGMSGDFEVQVGDPRKFYLYVVGMANDLTSDMLQERLMSNVVSVVETAVIDYVKQNNVSSKQIVLHKPKLSKQALKLVGEKLSKEYGITVFSFNIANIIIDSKESKVKVEENEVEKVLCKFCRAELLADAKFCVKCGKSQSSKKNCAQCNKENVSDARFCAYCGKPLGEEE